MAVALFPVAVHPHKSRTHLKWTLEHMSRAEAQSTCIRGTHGPKCSKYIPSLRTDQNSFKISKHRNVCERLEVFTAMWILYRSSGMLQCVVFLPCASVSDEHAASIIMDNGCTQPTYCIVPHPKRQKWMWSAVVVLEISWACCGWQNYTHLYYKIYEMWFL